jgi:hypothetical protein
MDDDQLLQNFLTFVDRIPLTWVCVRCGFEGVTAPDAEGPVGVQMGVRPDGRGGMEQFEVGPICGPCMSSKCR